MPPLMLGKEWDRLWYRRLLGLRVRYRFFPQCAACSGVQAGLLAAARRELDRAMVPGSLLLSPRGGGGGGAAARRAAERLVHRKAHVHGPLPPRLTQLTGALLGGVAVVGADAAEMRSGGARRYEALHRRLVGWAEAALGHSLPRAAAPALRRGVEAVERSARDALGRVPSSIHLAHSFRS